MRRRRRSKLLAIADASSLPSQDGLVPSLSKARLSDEPAGRRRLAGVRIDAVDFGTSPSSSPRTRSITKKMILIGAHGPAARRWFSTLLPAPLLPREERPSPTAALTASFAYQCRKHNIKRRKSLSAIGGAAATRAASQLMSAGLSTARPPRRSS